MKIPGVLYSLILAIAAWAVDYFSNGAGAGVPWAPILIATIPVLLKLITVQSEPTQPNPTQPSTQARGLGDAATPAQPSKVQRVLLG